MEPGRGHGRRKLLVASIGVATVSYAMLAGCGKDNVPTTGNLPAPPTVTPISGNLPGPPPVDAAPPPQPPPSAIAISGNLPAPPPPADAGVVKPKGAK